jgi:ketopantoate reductase
VLTNKAVAATPSVAEQIAPVVSKDTVICIIQNGFVQAWRLQSELRSYVFHCSVGNADPFRDAFPNNRIVSAVTWCGASQPEPGVISHFVEDSMQIGVEWSDDIPRDMQQHGLDTFVSLLESAGSKVEIVPSIGQWRWKVWQQCLESRLMEWHD